MVEIGRVEMKSVLVIMSTYNGSEYLEEQLESIINQEGQFTLDILVRDDGSTDNTIEILNKHMNQGSLKWYTGENLRSAQSFMNLIKNSGTYDYYAFADQDDVWTLDKIQNAIEQLDQYQTPALFFSNAELVDEHLQSMGRNVYRSIPKTDFETVSCAGGLLGCTMVFNDNLASKIKDRDLPKQIIMHDFYVALVCLVLDGAIVYSKESYVKYRQHSRNVVGVSHGVIGTIKGRIKDITTKQYPGIANQASELLRLYRDDLKSDNSEWLEIVSKYPDKLSCRIKLALSKKTKYINKNNGFKLRVAIFLGNR